MLERQLAADEATEQTTETTSAQDSELEQDIKPRHNRDEEDKPIA
ncbi:hypothetical protein [Methylophaga muralis]|nr:hypothetical protein [Methylophaga muralis]